ncbi:MAG: histidine--tRNA ligase [Nanoarchaeota archaeon]|nr:histidine--tRNA ligase [Nanoarchaeota archaeon]
MKPQTAKGVKDVVPEEKIIQNKVVGTLKEVFETYGFAPLETPIIERYETLAAKFAAGEDSDALKEIFKLTDQGKRKLGLRFDLTVPLARYIATNPTLKMPFKRYEIGSVFRDGPIKAGRLRQFWQCDVDTIGTSSLLADAELISILQTAFNKLKLDVVILVNNRKLLNGILEQAGIQKKEEAIIAIDKLDKIGVRGVSEELKGKGFNAKQIKTIFTFVKEGITLKELKIKVKNAEGLEGIKELEELFGYLRKMGVKKAKFEVSLARGLAYYTGMVCEVFLKSTKAKPLGRQRKSLLAKGKMQSSLAAGGRWDQMIGQFLGGNREVPAVGISFGLVPMMEALKEKEEFMEKTPTQIYVIPIKTTKESLEIVEKLRGAGIKTDFDLNGKGMSKNLQYANALGIPNVLIIGKKELQKKKVLLRDMKTGTESLLTVKQVIDKWMQKK